MTLPSTRLLPLSLLLGALFVGVGCADDDVGPDGTTVGGTCASADDCDSTCITSGDFPGGTCSVACSSNADCPEGTSCISNKGGVCLLNCTSAADCRAGYQCSPESNEEGGGQVLACEGA